MTLGFWTISFCSLLFVYGANTWLPSIMEDRGFAFRGSLAFLLSFNAGAIFGGILAGWLSDRLGSRRVIVASFIIGSAAIGIFIIATNAALLLVAAVFAGYGAVATQTLINGWVTRSYTAAARATGVGWSLGMGRIGGIIGPWATGMLAAGTVAGPFALFAGVALAGAGIAALIRRD